MGRLPAGLTSSMAVAVVSLGLLVILWSAAWPVDPGVELIVHICAGLALLWSLAALGIDRLPGLSRTDPLVRDLLAVLQIAIVVHGLVVVILMTYVAITEVLYRTPLLWDYQSAWHVRIWRTGLIDLGLIAAAVVLAWGRWRDPSLVTVCFWTLVLAGLWLSLQIPALHYVRTPGRSYTEMTAWAAMFVAWCGLLIAVFSAAESVRYRLRRARAWPDRLEDLVRSRKPWPGFHYSVGIIAVLLLILGCIHIESPWICPALLIAGIAILRMVHRHWEDSLADVGVGLLTLGLVAVPVAWLPLPHRPTADYFLEVFNRLVLGLAVMTAFWHWLARVWHQQLDAGRPWTTAGRLIRTVQRSGYLCGATGVLLALHLAVWPRWSSDVIGLDDSAWRWFWGLTAHALLAISLVWAARVTGKITLAALALFAVGAGVLFCMVRLGDARPVQWWVLYWPLALPVAAWVSTLAGLAARGSAGWKPFSPLLILLGVLILPAIVLGGLLGTDPARMPLWMLPATLGLLTMLYMGTALLARSRVSLLAAAVCLAWAAWEWSR